MRGIVFVAAVVLASGAGAAFPPMSVTLKGGGKISIAAKSPERLSLPGNPKAARLAERSPREGLRYAPVAAAGLSITPSEIRGALAPYTRFELAIKNTSPEPIAVEEITLFEDFAPAEDPGARISGNVAGSVAVFPKAGVFLAVENPIAKLSLSETGPRRLTAALPRGYAIRPGETWRVGAVSGRFAPGQLRRDFQAYLEAERAHPYRVLPHYNSWYDLNINRNDAPWQKRMNEAECLKAMRAFREALTKRGVFIDSYLWDDGWDNWDSLWDFHPGFPNGFRALADEAHKNKGASIGVWMSPCGGYGRSRGMRTAHARKLGLGGLKMSQPVYYKAFRDRCLAMIRDYDMNLFKFDNIGKGGDTKGPDRAHTPDMEATMRLIREMRTAKQDVFINATVGTWPSPFWLLCADSIWRGGADFATAGRAGPKRQRWLTYRDNQVHDRFAAPCPLFPLNSLMLHGIIVCRRGPPNGMGLDDSPASTRDFADEVWMSMGCGTGLQEYYITPSLMHEKWWDILAAGVRWLKENTETLRDVHWVGGDPLDGDAYSVYGYASLSEKKGIVLLRNPSAAPQTFTAALDDLLETPPSRKGAPVRGMKTVYASGEAGATASLPAVKKTDAPLTVSLPPFGVLLFEVW